jgi:hypothetical protein
MWKTSAGCANHSDRTEKGELGWMVHLEQFLFHLDRLNHAQALPIGSLLR